MNFLTVLTYVVAVVETGALIGAMVFLTKAIKEKRDTSARKARFRQGGIYVAVYFVLNALRLWMQGNM